MTGAEGRAAGGDAAAAVGDIKDGGNDHADEDSDYHDEEEDDDVVADESSSPFSDRRRVDNHNGSGSRCSLLRTALSSQDQMISMLSNFSTSYNAVNISLVLPVLQSPSLYQDNVTSDTDSVCASSLLAGMVLGQLLGGTLGDIIGRRAALYLVMVLQVGASLGSALLIWDGGGGSLGLTVFEQLAVWRFILGVGAGGVYPLAAVLSAEQGEGEGGDGESGGRAVFPPPPRLEERKADAGSGEESSLDSATSEAADELDTEDLRFRQAEETQRFELIALTFSTQGLGFLAVPAMTFPLLACAGESGLDIVWRIILGVGALPGLVLLCFRSRGHACGDIMRGCCLRGGLIGRWLKRAGAREPVPLEPPDEDGDGDAASTSSAQSSEDGLGCALPDGGGDMSLGGLKPDEHEEPLMDQTRNGGSRMEIDEEEKCGLFPPRRAGLWESIKSEPDLARKLCGTAGTWLLFDILFYGNTLFEPLVLEAAFGSVAEDDDTDGGADFDLLVSTARDALFLAFIALPGYFMSVVLIGRRTCYVVHQTPRYIQIQGFLCMAVLYFVVGAFWSDLKKVQWLLILLYGGTFFFANYGPNTTTFLLPSLTYSADCRSTLNGISAAAGKAGALLGATLFEPAADAFGDDKVLLICAMVSVLALMLTWFCVVSPGITLARSARRQHCHRD